MKKSFFAPIVLFVLLAGCKTTMLDFQARKGVPNTKEIFQNGKSMVASVRPGSVVVVSVEKTAVGSREMVALLNITLVEGGQEVVFRPESIEATGLIGNLEVKLIPQDPDQYIMIAQKKMARQQAWASSMNALSQGLNQTTANTYGQSGNTAGVYSANLQQQRLQKEQEQIAQQGQQKQQAIATSSTEFLRTTTLFPNNQELGGKVVFFPLNTKVGEFTSLKFAVSVGNDVHEIVFDVKKMQI